MHIFLALTSRCWTQASWAVHEDKGGLRDTLWHESRRARISVRPGNVKTELFTPNARLPIRVIKMVYLPLESLNVEEGAKNQLWAAAVKGAVSGEYYVPVGFLLGSCWEGWDGEWVCEG